MLRSIREHLGPRIPKWIFFHVGEKSYNPTCPAGEGYVEQAACLRTVRIEELFRISRQPLQCRIHVRQRELQLLHVVAACVAAGRLTGTLYCRQEEGDQRS